jgi:AcrR family transcriptional regulator
MTTSGPAAGRPLRADAARNLDRVLAAAREVFAEQGADAQVDDVARRAGVGVGTVYRRFPNKEALLEAVLAQRMAELDARAAEALAGNDPLAALAALVGALIGAAAEDRTLLTALCLGRDAPPGPGPGGPFHDAIGVLLDRARATGAVRADVAVEHVRPLVGGLVLAAVHTELGGDPVGGLRILLRGLRA